MTECSAAEAKFASNTSSKTVEQAMSVRKLTASLLTALMMLGGAASVHAQEHVPPADPFAFDPDFRWFEPVYDMDLMDMKPSKRASTGWFATYDRLNLYGSRPETEDPNASETRLDSGWGHRYQVGYMVPREDNGWMFTYTDMGVGEFFTVRRERLNRYNGDQVVGGSGGGSAVDPNNFGEIVPAADQNNQGFGYRFYDIADTENVFSYDSYELNKIWRLEPYHYGGILEPMVGFRWIRLKDTNAFQEYDSPLDFDEIPFTAFGASERLITNTAITEQEMVTAQVGFRYFKFHDRFTYSTDFRVFTGGSFQTSKATRATEITIYDEDTVTIGDPPLIIINRETEPEYLRNEEYMVGFDVRGEVSYQLTKMISVRGGFQLIDLATGVWRGGGSNLVPEGDQDQDLQMVGGTFGITLNR